MDHPMVCMTRTADVQPPSVLRDSLLKGVRLAYLEGPGFPVERSYEAFMTDQERFFNYVELCYNTCAVAVGFDLADVLGWRASLANLRQGLRNVPYTADDSYLRELLAHCGIYT